MKAKMLTPIASVQGKIAKGYYARILNGQQIIQRCPVRTKPPTTAQRRAQRDFVLRYAPHPKQPPKVFQPHASSTVTTSLPPRSCTYLENR